MDTSGTPLEYVIVDRLGAFFYWTRFYLTTMYHSTIPLRFIWSICSGNYG